MYICIIIIIIIIIEKPQQAAIKPLYCWRVKEESQENTEK